MKKSIPIIALGVFLSVSLLFADNLVPAYAVATVSSVTLPSGAVGIDTEFYNAPNTSSNLAYWTATYNGQIWLFSKPNNIYVTGSSVQLSGGGGGQMTYDTFRNYLWVFTSAGVYRFQGSNMALIDFTSNSGYAGVTDAVYDDIRDRIYAIKPTAVPSGAIFDISPTNPNSVTSWFNTNMGGYNTMGSSSWDIAVNPLAGQVFFNSATGSSGQTVSMITNLQGTWNVTRTVGNLGAGVTPYGIAVDEDFNWLAVTISDGSAVRKYDTSTTGNANMTLLATIAVGTIPRYIEVGRYSHLAFIGRSSANNVTVIDLAGNSLVSTHNACTNPIGHVSVKETDLSATTPTIYASFACQTNNVQSILITGAGILEPPNTGTGIDCTDPANANILICRLGGDGTLGSAGAFVIGNTTRGTGILGISCSMGIVDCTQDSNPQTNGLGLLIFIASLFIVVGMFYYAIGSRAFEMPIFIWAVIIIALSAFFTITGLIDPVFLILSVIAIIALTVPRLKGIIGGGGTFGGGSTE